MAKEFTAITTKYKGDQRILFQDIVLKTDNNINSVNKIQKYTAIWDTGATNTVVSNRVVEEMKLVPVGKVEVSTANGKTLTNKYIVTLELPNHLTINDIEVTGGNLGDNVNLLLGMDIITLGDFSITNVDKKTVFTFRYPSCETIDYCHQTRKIRNKNNLNELKKQEALLKQHGNEKCLCGSGLKYRYCCGKEQLKQIKETIKEVEKETSKS